MKIKNNLSMQNKILKQRNYNMNNKKVYTYKKISNLKNRKNRNYLFQKKNIIKEHKILKINTIK